MEIFYTKCHLDSRVIRYFFIYSSPIRGELNYLEIFRYFRTMCYENIDAFYVDFFSSLESFFPGTSTKARETYDPGAYLKEFPFYTANDRWFRFLRDNVLGDEDYHLIMLRLLRRKKFNIRKNLSNLWVNEDQIRELYDNGNIIGLHSYSHPTNMKKSELGVQREEYTKNFQHLSELICKEITSMSHPCGSYNNDTLEILDSLGIKVGFRSNMETKNVDSLLEMPRENHTNIYKKLRG